MSFQGLTLLSSFRFLGIACGNCVRPSQHIIRFLSDFDASFCFHARIVVAKKVFQFFNDSVIVFLSPLNFTVSSNDVFFALNILGFTVVCVLENLLARYEL